MIWQSFACWQTAAQPVCDAGQIWTELAGNGERLRLNLAHTMVKKPRLMLLNEPTASLDNKSKVLVKDMLLKLKQEDTSMIGIFHDLELWTACAVLP